MPDSTDSVETEPVDELDPESAEAVPAASRGVRRLALPIAVGVALVAIVVAAVLFTPAGGPGPGDTAGTPADMGVAEVGSPAPDFALTTIDGKTFRLSENRGKTVLVNFWGTWCPPCEREMPELVNAYDRSGGEAGKRVIVGVAVNDVDESVRRFVVQKKIDFPVGLDEGAIAGRYLVSAFPTSVLIDSNGVVRERISRAFPDAASVESAFARAEATPIAAPR